MCGGLAEDHIVPEKTWGGGYIPVREESQDFNSNDCLLESDSDEEDKAKPLLSLSDKRLVAHSTITSYTITNNYAIVTLTCCFIHSAHIV